MRSGGLNRGTGWSGMLKRRVAGRGEGERKPSRSKQSSEPEVQGKVQTGPGPNPRGEDCTEAVVITLRNTICSDGDLSKLGG